MIVKWSCLRAALGVALLAASPALAQTARDRQVAASGSVEPNQPVWSTSVAAFAPLPTPYTLAPHAFGVYVVRPSEDATAQWGIGYAESLYPVVDPNSGNFIGTLTTWSEGVIPQGSIDGLRDPAVTHQGSLYHIVAAEEPGIGSGSGSGNAIYYNDFEPNSATFAGWSAAATAPYGRRFRKPWIAAGDSASDELYLVFEDRAIVGYESMARFGYRRQTGGGSWVGDEVLLDPNDPNSRVEGDAWPVPRVSGDGQLFVGFLRSASSTARSIRFVEGSDVTSGPSAGKVDFDYLTGR